MITRRIHRLDGFSLIEVMVALIVLSVGLLGVARMQSLALSSTSVANKRSLAAIEADSLAAMMHENRGYWFAGDPAGATITIKNASTGTTFDFGSAAALGLAAGSDCSTSGAPPCTPAKIAAYDLSQWAQTLQSMLPSSSATIACGNVTPLSCTIQIRWDEHVVSLNSQSEGQAENAAAAMQIPTYTLYVEP